MTEQVGPQLWKDIVGLTDASGNECVRSLRIAIFMMLKSSTNERFWRQARRSTLSGRCLLPMRRTPLAKIEKGRLLFCFAHRTASNMHNLLPVAREAHRRGTLGGIISAGDYSEELAEFVGQVPIMTANDLLSQMRIGERSQIIKEAVSAFSYIATMLSKHDSTLGRRYRSNAGSMFSEVVISLQMARAFRLLLESWLPSAVVCTSDLWPMEYQLVQEARAKAIRSLVIQHGNLIYFYWPFAANLYAVWGQEPFEEMLALGAPPDRLAVAGMPASDTLFGQGNVNAAPRKCDGTSPVCLVLSHTHARHIDPELYRDYGRFLSKVIGITPGVRWKVKLHPSENQSFYDELVPEIRGRLEFYPQSTSLKDALRDADIVTTLFSTAGTEAMIAGFPVLVPIVSPRMEELHSLPQVHGALRVKLPEEFRHELEMLVTDPQYRGLQLERQRTAIDRGFANQGHASEAIVDLLEKWPLNLKPGMPQSESPGTLTAVVRSKSENSVVSIS